MGAGCAGKPVLALHHARHSPQYSDFKAVPRRLEVGGQDIGNGENKCAKRAN